MSEPYPDGPHETQPPDHQLLTKAIHRLLDELDLDHLDPEADLDLGHHHQRVQDVRDAVARYRAHHGLDRED